MLRASALACSRAAVAVLQARFESGLMPFDRSLIPHLIGIRRRDFNPFHPRS
jgi:hypothetical protein